MPSALELFEKVDVEYEATQCNIKHSMTAVPRETVNYFVSQESLCFHRQSREKRYRDSRETKFAVSRGISH